MLSAYAKEGTHGRPVAHNNDYLLVNFSLSLIQIMDVDEKNQILKTSIWYHYVSGYRRLVTLCECLYIVTILLEFSRMWRGFCEAYLIALIAL